MNQFSFRLAWLSGLIAVALSCPAAEDEIKHPTETAILVVTVIDQDGEPIEGATIKPYACRCEEQPSTGWSWPVYNVGQPSEVLTDAKGIVKVKYPIKFGADPDWMTTSEITATVIHPEFIGQELHVDPRVGNTQLALKPGCQLTFSANDAAGTPVEFGILMAGPGRTAKWIREESGEKRSRAIPDGVWQTMLVSPRDDGQHLFSSLLPIRLRDGQAVSVRNVRLRPGIRVHGEVSAEVTRPVANGRVIAHVLPKPAGPTWGRDEPSVSWQTASDIRPDGTFEFASLPRTGLLQVITICDGYVGSNTDVPGRVRGMQQGLFIELDDYDPVAGLTIPMERTGTVRVKVLDPDGMPLADAQVIMCPNHSLHLGGSTILGFSWESVEEMKAQMDHDHQLPKFDVNASRYTAKTDADGIASIGSLPLGRSESIYVSHEDFVIPSAIGGHDRRVSVEVNEEEPVKVEIKLEALETALQGQANRQVAQEFGRAAGDFAEQAADLIGNLLGN